MWIVMEVLRIIATWLSRDVLLGSYDSLFQSIFEFTFGFVRHIRLFENLLGPIVRYDIGTFPDYPDRMKCLSGYV